MVDADILLKCAKEGNADSFGLLYGMYAKELYLYAYKFLGNKEDAEDAVSQASINVFKSITSIKNSNSFKAYYFKALANTCKNILKKRGPVLVSCDEMEDRADIKNTENEVIENIELQKALSRLKDDEREIVLLCVISGFTSKQVASIVGMTRGAVRSKLSRSLKKLRDEIESEKV